MDTLTLRIVKEVQNRLGTITIAGGFNTNAGVHTYRGRRELAPGCLPYISIMDMAENATEKGNFTDREIVLELDLVGYIQADDDNPADAANALVGDIKKAIMTPTDWYRLGGLAIRITYLGRRNIYPARDERGVAIVVCHFKIQYSERCGDPYYGKGG